MLNTQKIWVWEREVWDVVSLISEEEEDNVWNGLVRF